MPVPQRTPTMPPKPECRSAAALGLPWAGVQEAQEVTALGYLLLSGMVKDT